MYLSIKTDILLNNALSDKAITTMLIMSGLRSDFEITVIVPEQIISVWYNTLSESKRKDEEVNKAIIELISNNIINPVECKNKVYRIKTSELTISNSESNFVLITREEFEQLKHKPRLLRYFLVVISTINNVSKVGFNTIEQLAHKSRIKDAGTIINYNRTLVETGLLYIYNQHQFINGQQTANTYGRAKDKDIIIKNAIEYYDIRNFATDRSMSASEKRSISANYNNYLKGRYKGDVFKLRADCKRYNELCGGRNMKDLNVFPEVKGIRASPFMVDLMERNGVDTSNFYVRGEYD